MKQFFELASDLLGKLINFFMKEEQIINGALEDNRSEEEKAKDYTHVEVLGGAVSSLTWVEKPQSQWIKLSKREQITSSSCGGQAGAKAEEALSGVISSANPIYRNRSNYPDGGMIQIEIGQNLKKIGTCYESVSPSQNMTEDQMNAVILPTDLPFKVSAYYIIPGKTNTDMDVLKTALDKGHAIIPLISSNNQEYGSVPVYNGQPSTFGHFVCCVPGNDTLYNGEKSLVIDDSCAVHSTVNQSGQRIFTESWLKQRCVSFLALIKAIPETIPPTIHHQFNVDLSYGMMNNPDVVVLQDILKVEGCMQTSIPSTGNFLSISKASLIKLQNKYKNDILTPVGLTEGTGYCGVNTRNWLNKHYA